MVSRVICLVRKSVYKPLPYGTLLLMFTDGINRRRFRRISVNIPTTIFLKKNENRSFEGETQDISEGGAFVHCTVPIMVGDEVLIKLHFEETKIFETRVVDWDEWVRKHIPEEDPERSVIKWVRGSSVSGFGVEFVDLHPDKKAFLTRLIDRFEEFSKAGEKLEK